MKMSKILVALLMISQALGLNAHAMDPETIEKALKWAAEQQAKKQAQESGKSQAQAEAEAKAKAKQDAEQKAAEAQAQLEAQKQAAEAKAQQEKQKQAEAAKQAAEQAEKKALEEAKAKDEAAKQAAIEAQKKAQEQEAQKQADLQKKQQEEELQGKLQTGISAEAETAKTAQKVPAASSQQDISKNTLNYSTVVDIGSFKGSTFFSLMESKIKPALDYYATAGFHIIDGNEVERILPLVDRKVSRSAIAAAGTLENLKRIADGLAASGQPITFHNLPAAIAQIDKSVNRFDLQEFFGLASGGGVAVRVMDGVYAYNVNYGTGYVQMDAQSGRSFGEAAGRLARDASDADYLQMLERYVRKSSDNASKFYQSMLEILVNNDVSTFSAITDEGQIVASDFLAVYVAEQDRHLMVNLQSQHWDRALLEVTLLSAFHAGQSEVAVMYNGILTSTTYKQVRNCTDPNLPAPAKIPKKAGMLDYWQFSTNTEKPNCVRSGINLTNRDFRKLGRLITQYERQVNPKLVQAVERHLKGIQLTDNLFADLSNFLIRYQTPKSFDAKTLELPADFTRFLNQVKADANAITSAIYQNQ